MVDPASLPSTTAPTMQTTMPMQPFPQPHAMAPMPPPQSTNQILNPALIPSTMPLNPTLTQQQLAHQLAQQQQMAQQQMAQQQMAQQQQQMNQAMIDEANRKEKKARKPYTITKPRESWTKEEHTMFLDALKLYERDWKQIGEMIKTKSIIQIRSHAQKYFIKMGKMGLNEHIPPPRPKKRTKRSSKSGSSKRRKTENGAKESGSESESGSGSEGGSDDEESASNSEAQTTPRATQPTPTSKSKPTIKIEEVPTVGPLPTAPISDRSSDSPQSSRPSQRKTERASKSSRSKNTKKKKSKAKREYLSDSSSDRSDSDDDEPQRVPKSPERRSLETPVRGGRHSRNAPGSPSSFNAHIASLPANGYEGQWLDGTAMDSSEQYFHNPAVDTNEQSNDDLAEEETDRHVPLRRHNHNASTSNMSFTALSQLSPLSQLSQATDVLDAQDHLLLPSSSSVNHEGDESGAAEQAYGPFPENWDYQQSHTNEVRQAQIRSRSSRAFSVSPRSTTGTAFGILPMPSAPSRQVSSSSTGSRRLGPKPDMSKVYAFLASMFDPNGGGSDAEALASMDDTTRTVTEELSRNLAVNIASSDPTSHPSVARAGNQDMTTTARVKLETGSLAKLANPYNEEPASGKDYHLKPQHALTSQLSASTPDKSTTNMFTYTPRSTLNIMLDAAHHHSMLPPASPGGFISLPDMPNPLRQLSANSLTAALVPGPSSSMQISSSGLDSPSVNSISHFYPSTSQASS